MAEKPKLYSDTIITAESDSLRIEQTPATLPEINAAGFFSLDQLIEWADEYAKAGEEWPLSFIDWIRRTKCAAQEN